MSRTLRTLILALIVTGALAPGDALAYLDPGTGGIIIQGLIAAVIAGMVWLRHSWAAVKAFIARLLGRAPDDPSA